jgi:hypothetical protein
MDKSETSEILIIDDQTDEHTSIKLYLEESSHIKVKVLHPQEVTVEDLLTAHLVLVDYQLETWQERDNLDALSLKPSDGLALASVLRRHLHDREQASPTAFALYTGKIEKLAHPFPPDYREHALASINNLEWVFQKAKPETKTSVASQIIELADAVSVLPQSWSSGSEGQPMRQLADLLNIRFDAAQDEPLLADVEACLPPIHELSQWSHGLAVLRWLLQRILPFPCFLSDTFRLAARFRIDHETLRNALEEGKPLREKLDSCTYSGILATFLGARWWRSKIEAFLWDITGGNSANIKAVQQAIREAAQEDLPLSIPPDHPVVCVNTHYQPLNTFYRMEESVRIRPDDWPAYADQAWTTIELARSEPKLRALVIHEDLELLG